MLYVELNDGRTENLMHISHFETEDEAQNRYEELQKDLLAN